MGHQKNRQQRSRARTEQVGGIVAVNPIGAVLEAAFGALARAYGNRASGPKETTWEWTTRNPWNAG